MSEEKGMNIIQSLQKKWSLQIALAYVVMAVAVSLFIATILVKLLHQNWLVILPILVICFALFYFLVMQKINAQDVVRFLNQAFPELQESTQLVLQPTDQLNGLEKLQLRKIESQLTSQIPSPQGIQKKLKASFMMLIMALLFAFLFSVIPFKKTHSLYQNNSSINPNFPSEPETKLPEIKAVNITIAPPLYTRKPAREQDKFNISAEQKAVVTWAITTTRKANDVQFVFNDKSTLHLKATDNKGTHWLASKQILQPGFYQVKMDDKLSELYQIEMIPDAPPIILIQSPKQSTFIKWGDAQKINISVLLSDDYGIDSALIHATTASGSGEAVTFKERRFLFPNFHSGNQKYQLQKMIDLPSLGLTPGDELYFYITAKDNNQQEKRSDIFIVRLEDTAQLFSMTGLKSGIDVKPELFRSERQIIIETEQLLRDKDTISVESFNQRSSNLGSDQELLRLRYGKYLGEETETEIGGDHHADAQNEAADFGNAAKVIDEYSHKHDIAEDADFFDAPTKKQLQAMLTEMWKASLQLKTYKPKEALPFAYNALRLLKDLQQKTRAYVAKTGVQTTPLNPAKRLTGELDKIVQPATQQNEKQKDSSVQTIRKALGVLEKLRSKEALQKSDVAVLEEAGTQLSAMAASHPVAYLAAYEALQKIIENEVKTSDINVAGNAFQKMITSFSSQPQGVPSAPDMNLSKRYFMNLNKRND